MNPQQPVGAGPMAPQVQQQQPTMPMRNPLSSQAVEKTDHFIQASFKQDIAKSRELLTELLNKSTAILQENNRQPGSQRDSHRLRLEKGMEDLFAVLDQMETNLKLALQWHNQTLDSKRHVPAVVATKRMEENQNTISLQNYMKVAKIQIKAAKELHDLISDTENKLAQASVPPTPVSSGPPILLPSSSSASTTAAASTTLSTTNR